MSKLIKKIAVVTGARAEYGILQPLLKEIKDSSGFKLELIVTGMHLLKQHGSTIREIKKDGFKINNKVAMYRENARAGHYHGEALGRGVVNFTKTLLKIKPDILIVLGDRLEPLAATLAAASLTIPIIHLHGGEKTDSGHIDESIRHAITRFAQIHLVATEKSKARLLKMGEEPWRIFNVGALGLESILNYPKINRRDLFKKFQMDFRQKFILCIFHPIFKDRRERGQMIEILKALRQLKIQSIIIYPNNDYGAEGIIKEIKKYKNLPFIKVYPNLNHNDYISLLKQADVLIGNSSSGIIEAPSIKLPAINVGLRNTGREHGSNVIFIGPKKNDIVKAINRAFYDKKFRRKLEKGENPYGRGKTVDKIINILSRIKINKKLLVKYITY